MSMDTNTGYIPREGSLPARVIAFFQDNPEEELGRADIAAKFDVNPSSVDVRLAEALAAGLLTKGTDADGRVVWRSGNPSTESIERRQAQADALPFERHRPPARAFACALASDGRLRLYVNGFDFTLSVGETHKLIRYLGRIGDSLPRAGDET